MECVAGKASGAGGGIRGCSGRGSGGDGEASDGNPCDGDAAFACVMARDVIASLARVPETSLGSDGSSCTPPVCGVVSSGDACIGSTGAAAGTGDATNCGVGGGSVWTGDTGRAYCTVESADRKLN